MVLLQDLAKTTNQPAQATENNQTWDEFAWHGFDAVLKSEKKTLKENPARALAKRLEAQVVAAKVGNSGPQT
jgi:hypothetical protein